MISMVLKWMLARKLNVDAFPGQISPHAHSTTTEVFDAFQKGAHCGVDQMAASKVDAIEADVPWNRRPFFWEGLAFGISARHALTFSSGNPNNRYRDEGYRYMFYTGLGFWNAVAKRNFLRTVSVLGKDWQDVEDYEFRGPMQAGGDSFAHVCETGSYKASDLKRVKVPPGENWHHMKLFGIGRALWFLYMGDFQKLESVLEAHPEDASWIASGLGLAMTYTQIGTPERILPALSSISAKYAPDIIRGSIVALYGWGEDDPRSEEHLEKMGAPFVEWREQGRITMDAIPKDSKWHLHLDGQGAEKAREFAERDLMPLCKA